MKTIKMLVSRNGLWNNVQAHDLKQIKQKLHAVPQFLITKC